MYPFLLAVENRCPRHGLWLVTCASSYPPKSDTLMNTHADLLAQIMMSHQGASLQAG